MSESRDRLTLRPPANPVVASQMDYVREAIIRLGEDLESVLPPGRELSLALTKLEELTFWAIAAIARSEPNIPRGASAPI